ncbi:hydantoinase/oxoprolinase family protein [Gordonia sp. TBRC 11910]|uniref:Hydantoinase/oxoprolinase family protein n=1 Tax=Gordonia asplenii TaxID=2725283 RepID=A0A848KNP1_9ACTN|nr:hydantoinase/oxoprolinase family protein [Gordonia asplenii]NMO00664.1 hydantoinase/oxoprolinase family protein [Gordonia asplenii]
MRRVSVDIGGTFTDCFVVWDERTLLQKSLTTHQNLAIGFNEALETACKELQLTTTELLSGVDSVRYATTLGTNALIERKGPRVGLLTTAGFRSSVPLARAKGYGVGLDWKSMLDIPNAERPDAIVPIPLIREVNERIDFEGDVLLTLNEDRVRSSLRELIDHGAETIVVCLANSVVNPAHELRIREIFLEEYPGHLLGAIPMLLSHQVSGRKGEYTRATSTIMDGFLHSVMYHGLGTLELHLRDDGYDKPMLVIHNSGGMAQLNSTDALQTVHSGPVAGIAASEALANTTGLGNVVATDMGGTSFDIGIVVEGGVKHYDFEPVIERWMVSVPMVHLVTLGAGGGSICSYDSVFKTVAVGPESAGSDPGPACYDRGGLLPTVTDSDLLLGYLDPENYAGGKIALNRRRSKRAVEDELCDDLDLDVTETAKLIKRTVDSNMANGIATELRVRGFEPADFTFLAYGGNGPLHGCGIASALGVSRVLCPPHAPIFSAVGAGDMNQMHIHEANTWIVLFDPTNKYFMTDFTEFNEKVAELEARGRADLERQGIDGSLVKHRLELDMRYGNQRVQTAVQARGNRITSQKDVLDLISAFDQRYAERFGEGSQATATGVRVNTVRVLSWVETPGVPFADLTPLEQGTTPEPVATRECHFVGVDGGVPTSIFDDAALTPGTDITGPAVIETEATTYLVEPGWRYQAVDGRAVWMTRIAD